MLFSVASFALLRKEEFLNASDKNAHSVALHNVLHIPLLFFKNVSLGFKVKIFLGFWKGREIRGEWS